MARRPFQRIDMKRRCIHRHGVAIKLINECRIAPRMDAIANDGRGSTDILPKHLKHRNLATVFRYIRVADQP